MLPLMQVPGSHAFPAWLKPRVFVRWEINFTVFPTVCKSFPLSNYTPRTKATITISKQSAYTLHAISISHFVCSTSVARRWSTGCLLQSNLCHLSNHTDSKFFTHLCSQSLVYLWVYLNYLVSAPHHSTNPEEQCEPDDRPWSKALHSALITHRLSL